MNALITGGAGFIGGRLAHALVAEGWTVRVFDDLSAGKAANVPTEGELIVGDLRDRGAVQEATQGADVVFHQGAVRSVARSMADPELSTSVNVLGSLNVLMAAEANSSRVVAASSSSVYGDQATLPLREHMELRPKSPYAASKVAMESFCSAYWLGYGVRTVCLRYFNAYGPGQDPTSQYALVIPLFITACLNGERAVIHGDGEQSRDFTYIDDVVQANLRAAAANDEAWGRGFNIAAGGEPTSVNELLAQVAALTGSTVEPVREPARAGDMRHTAGDISLARRLLGYEPQFDLRSGLKITVDAFR